MKSDILEVFQLDKRNLNGFNMEFDMLMKRVKRGKKLSVQCESSGSKSKGLI